MLCLDVTLKDGQGIVGEQLVGPHNVKVQFMLDHHVLLFLLGFGVGRINDSIQIGQGTQYRFFVCNQLDDILKDINSECS